MPDLKMDAEAVVAKLGKAVDNAINGLRGEAERLIADVRMAAAVLANPAKIDITSADAACVIDFYNNYSGARQIDIHVSGGSGGYTQLMQELPAGKYRALVILSKLDE